MPNYIVELSECYQLVMSFSDYTYQNDKTKTPNHFYFLIEFLA